MPENFGDPSSSVYGTLMVRGNEVSVTHGAINSFYGTYIVEDFQGQQDFDKIARVLTKKDRSC